MRVRGGAAVALRRQRRPVNRTSRIGSGTPSRESCRIRVVQGGRDGSSRARLTGGGMAGNIADYFGHHLARPAQVLYRQFAGDAWRDVAAGALAADIARWQAAFRREGLVPGDRIALCVRNGVDWVAIDLAALGLQLVVVPLFVDDAVGNVAWCVADAQARLVIVENARLATGLARPDLMAAPPAIVVLRGDGTGSTAAATPADRFLPRDGGRRGVPIVFRRHAGDDLLHVGHGGAAERRDAVARQHHRQRRRPAARPAWRARMTASCRSCRSLTCSSARAGITCRSRWVRRWSSRAASRTSPPILRRRRRPSSSPCRGYSSACRLASTNRCRHRR